MIFILDRWSCWFGIEGCIENVGKGMVWRLTCILYVHVHLRAIYCLLAGI